MTVCIRVVIRLLQGVRKIPKNRPRSRQGGFFQTRKQIQRYKTCMYRGIIIIFIVAYRLLFIYYYYYHIIIRMSSEIETNPRFANYYYNIIIYSIYDINNIVYTKRDRNNIIIYYYNRHHTYTHYRSAIIFE